MFLNTDHTHITDNTSKPCYNNANPFRPLVYVAKQLNSNKTLVNSPQFTKTQLFRDIFRTHPFIITNVAVTLPAA